MGSENKGSSLSIEGRNITVTMESAPGKALEQSDIAKLMRVGACAPWSEQPDQRYSDKGNDVLYHFCEEYPLPDNLGDIDSTCEVSLTREESIFASKMWLIGRSYAASPERYAYTGKSSKPKEDKTAEYESFFGDITRILFRGEAFYRGEKSENYALKDELHSVHLKFKCVLKKLVALSRDAYSLGTTSENKYELKNPDLFNQVIECVCCFSEVIRQARYIRDTLVNLSKTSSENTQIELPDQFYPLSFSSKFLHFHYPKSVFIFDGITGDCLSPSKKIERYFKDGSSISLSIEIPNEQNDDEQDEHRTKYRIHAAKELAIATAVIETFVKKDAVLKDVLKTGKLETINADPIPCYYNITRMIDALASNVSKKKPDQSDASTEEQGD